VNSSGNSQLTRRKARFLRLLCSARMCTKLTLLPQLGQPGPAPALSPPRNISQFAGTWPTGSHQRAAIAHHVRSPELGQNIRRCSCGVRGARMFVLFAELTLPTKCRHNIKAWDVMFCGPRPLKVALEETCRSMVLSHVSFARSHLAASGIRQPREPRSTFTAKTFSCWLRPLASAYCACKGYGK
jgi:hypothetical protein